MNSTPLVQAMFFSSVRHLKHRSSAVEHIKTFCDFPLLGESILLGSPDGHPGDGREELHGKKASGGPHKPVVHLLGYQLLVVAVELPDLGMSKTINIYVVPLRSF